MDEADMKLLEDTIGFLEKNRKKDWIDLHNLRIIKYGSIYHFDCHITLPWYYDIKKAHLELTEVESLIKEHFDHHAEMFIHNDPCREDSCKLCEVSDCEVRKHNFEKRLEWNVTNVLSSSQHHLE